MIILKKIMMKLCKKGLKLNSKRSVRKIGLKKRRKRIKICKMSRSGNNLMRKMKKSKLKNLKKMNNRKINLKNQMKRQLKNPKKQILIPLNHSLN